MASEKSLPMVYRLHQFGIVTLGCAFLSGMMDTGPSGRARAQEVNHPVPAKKEMSPSQASLDEAFTKHLRPILQKYCFECHSGEKAKGDLQLDTLASDFKATGTVMAWEKVAGTLASHTMPPKTKPQPSEDEAKALRNWLESGLTVADAARQQREGRAVMRRLTRFEYVNTIRDLLAVDVHLQELLPEDLAGASGFDNDGLALRVSSVLLERYMEAVDVALESAFVPGPKPVTTKAKLSYKNEKQYAVAKRNGTVAELEGAVVLLNEQAIALSQFHSKAPGLYRIRVSAYAYHHDQPLVMAAHSRGRGAKASAGTRLLGYYAAPSDKPAIVEFVTHLDEDNTLVLGPEGAVRVRGKGDHSGLAVEWVEVEGPLIDVWPPESYQRLLGKVDLKTAKLADAERVLRTFISRAFRRPASDKLVRPYVEMVGIRLEQGYAFEHALRVAVKAVLCSPRFLFFETQVGQLDDFALATRLSYFLWSSMPDQELFDLADKKALHTPETLRQQVERMLKDPKAAAFSQNFLDQWLDLRQIDSTVPDKMLYPEFTEFLKISMQQETRLFFGEILKDDLSLLNFVDSDFALLNEPLARHYGITGVLGPEFRKVKLPPGSHRGGLLTQASVLKVTANGTTTSPVLRGVWVLKNILGQPVPPPPPNVPAIEPDTRGAVTIRAQLAKHRELESCATCHRKIDPLGFALENFDVMGGWRENYRVIGPGKKNEKLDLKVGGRAVQYHKGSRVEAGDVMSDGQKFKDVDEFKRILLSDPDSITRCVAEKLLVYATGSDIRAADRPAVAAMVKRVRAKNYRLRELVHEVVQSELFLNK